MSGNLHTLMLGRITVSRTFPTTASPSAVWAALEAAPRWPEVLNDLVRRASSRTASSRRRDDPHGRQARHARGRHDLSRGRGRPAASSRDRDRGADDFRARTEYAIDAFATGARVTVTSAVEPVRWLHRITTALARPRIYQAIRSDDGRTHAADARARGAYPAAVGSVSSLWTSPFPCAKLGAIKNVPREGSMTIKRILPAILAAVFALVSGSAQAEVKKGVDRLHPRHQEAQRLCRLRRRQERQASRHPDDPCPRGHDAEDAGDDRDVGEARLRGVRRRHLRLWRRRAAEERRGNVGADHDLPQGPPADTLAHAGRLGRAGEAPAGRRRRGSR